MTAKGDAQRCKGPGCNRIITFLQPQGERNLLKFNDRSPVMSIAMSQDFNEPVFRGEPRLLDSLNAEPVD